MSCLIGNGVVLSPAALLTEIDGLEKQGVEVMTRLHISEACPLILPYHVALDQARERARATGRSAPPVAALARPTRTRCRDGRFGWAICSTGSASLAKLGEVLDFHTSFCNIIFRPVPVDFQQVLDETLEMGERLRRWRTISPRG